MSDLFDFLGCMSLFNGGSSGSPHSRPAHPKRQPPKLLLPTSSIPSAALTPHPPSQPYHSHYPITRAPTVRETVISTGPAGQAMLPNYPFAVRQVSRYSQMPHASSPHTYWKTYGSPNPTMYMPQQPYGPQAYSESYMPLPVNQSRPPMAVSYCAPPVENDYYPRSIGEMDPNIEDDDPMWAYRSYPSQFPAAQERVTRIRPVEHYVNEPVASEPPYLVQTRVYQQSFRPPVIPVGATGGSQRQLSAAMSCTIAPSASPSPSRAAAPTVHEQISCVSEDTVLEALRDEKDFTQNLSGSCPVQKDVLGESKVVDLDRGPVTTMAETSDDADASDSCGAHGRLSCISHELIQHSPDVVGDNPAEPCVPSECICQHCCDLDTKGLRPEASYAKEVESPLEFHKSGSEGPPCVSVEPEREILSSEQADRSCEDLVEAGVGTTECMESGAPISWSSCSSATPMISEAEMKAQKGLLMRELVRKMGGFDYLGKTAGYAGEAGLVQKRVREWDERAMIYSDSGLSQRPKRISGVQMVPERPAPEQAFPSADKEEVCIMGDKASAPNEASPHTDFHRTSESLGSPTWSRFVDSFTASQKHSPSPTQVPRNPFLADTERCLPGGMSPNVVTRSVNPEMTKNQSAPRLPGTLTETQPLWLTRQFSAVVRDDLDRQLRAHLKKHGIRFEFVRLKRGYYAVCRPTAESGESKSEMPGSGLKYESAVYFGRAQQTVAQLPPTVICYAAISLDFGRLVAAVLSRSDVVRHFGVKAVWKWLTPNNCYFARLARHDGITTERRRRSTGMCAQSTARRFKGEPPSGGETPWRNGQLEPFASFVQFVKVVASHMIPREGNSEICPCGGSSDPLPTRSPRHNRRASS